MRFGRLFLSVPHHQGALVHTDTHPTVSPVGPVYRNKDVLKPLAVSVGAFAAFLVFIAVVRMFTDHTHVLSLLIGMCTGPFFAAQFRASRDAYRLHRQQTRLAAHCSV